MKNNAQRKMEHSLALSQWLAVAAGMTAILTAAGAVSTVQARQLRASGPAGPAEGSYPRVTAATGTDIALGGRVVMRIREGAGGYSAEQRTAIVRDRLIPILAITDLTPGDVVVRQVPDGSDVAAAIYVRDRLLITIGEPLARANESHAPLALAHTYAERLRQILPQVVAKPEDSPFAPPDARTPNPAPGSSGGAG